MQLSAAEHRRLAHRYRRRRELTAWLFVAPFLVFFVVFLVGPVLQVFWWSTREGSIAIGSVPVGLDNFRSLPDQVDAIASIRNTFVFAAVSIPITLVLALLIAVLLVRVRRGGPVYRFLIYFPVLVPGVVAGLIWVFLTNYDFGLFNQVLTLLGGQPHVWLGTDSALYVLAVLDVWRNVGYWAIFFVAALQGMPQELFDAAEVDGATPTQRFFRITLPMLRRVILFAVVVATIWGLQVFDTALILTAGGPGTATVTIVYQVWTYIFSSPSGLGYGAAVSVVLLVAILILTLIQLRLLRGRRGSD
jgi:ABC-type sugar transport system permease subunit